jgi:hypothetical protein
VRKVVLALILATVPVAAQWGFKREVFGAVGAGSTYDDEGSLGRGINGGGGIGYRLTPRLGFEAEVNAFRSKRDFGPPIAPFEHSGAHFMGNALLHVNRGRAQFYLIGGAGVLHIHNTGTNRSHNGLSIDLGLGIKIFVTPHVYIRPDARAYVGSGGSAAESPFSDLRIAAGAGYSW